MGACGRGLPPDVGEAVPGADPNITHNPNIAVFAPHQDRRMEVASGKHLEVTDTT